nr:putative reverse transcriptase domain-containing protein [Tanacetum cinerariifolium]
MVAILEKTEHNTNFHHIVDFLEASHIRYALMVRPTVYVSHIRQFWSTARVETTDGEIKILAKVNGRQRTVSESSVRRHLKLNDDKVLQGEGSEHPSEPHHIPSDQDEPIYHKQITQSPQHVQTTSQEPTIPSQSHSVISKSRRITKGIIRISQSKVLSPGADETAFPTGDVRNREAFPTDNSLDVGQDRENISKTSTMPHEALPRVTSIGGGKGSMQQKLQELMDICTSLQRQHSLMKEMVQSQDLEITQLNASTNEMSHVLGTLGAENILASGGLMSVFTTASTGVSPAVATTSGSFPTAAIFTTASVATPTTRVTRSSIGVVIRSSSPISVNIPFISKKGKGKGKVTEPEQPSKEKNKLRDSEIARIHGERELEMMIAELDRSNEMVAKYFSEYKQAEVGLSHDEKIEEKFIPVWEKMQDFVPMNSKLESERLKRPGIQLDKERFKKLETTEASSTESTQGQQTEELTELSEEVLKNMMKLVPVEELYIDALQVKYLFIDWEIFSEGQRKCWKIIKVRNHTKVYQIFKDMLKKFNREDLDKFRVWSRKLAAQQRSHVCWSEVRDSQLTSPELVREMTEKIVQIKNRLLTAHSRQKSYTNRRTKPLEFEVGNMVLLKVSSCKGVMRFGKREKFSPRYIGPFRILARVGPVAYMLELPKELKGIHSTFHVLNLKKCLAEGDIIVPIEEIQLDDKLHVIEDPVEIVDIEVKRLKQIRIPILKVHWNS